MKNNRVAEFVKNPKKAFYTLAIPVIITMTVQTMYNLIDTAFVGRLGSDAIAALTFSFPLFFLMIAINAGIGSGMSSRIARYLGEKNKKDAENTAMHGIVISLAMALIIFIIGTLYIEQIFTFFGAKGEVFNLAIDYMKIIFWGFLFMFPAFIFSGIFSAQGGTKIPMVVNISSLILNTILDPIFIFGLELGVKGAAYASIISFILSLILFIYLSKTKSYLNISFKSFKLSKHILAEIFKVGLPASIMMLMMSVYLVFLNKFMSHFGTKYVAAFGLVSKLETLTIMPFVSFGIATLTLVGMFYGSKRYDLVKMISWFAIKRIIIITSIIGLIMFFVPKLLIRIFTTDQELILISANYLRIDVLTFPLMAISMISSRIMQGLGYGVPGLIIHGVRIFGVALPLAYIFVFVLGWSYIYVALSTVVGGAASSLIGLILLKSKLKKLKT